MADDNKDKKYILWINLFMQIVFCFFSVFFNIYVYEVSKNFNIVILYTLTFVVFGWLLNVMLLKHISKKFLSAMFKLSFVLCLICTLLTFFITKQNLWLVFVIQMLYALTAIFYYIPSEVSTMTKNTKGQMKKFMSLNSSLSVFSAVLSPFLSGYIIDYISYYVLFSIMIVCIVICFIFSTKIKLVNQEIEHINIKDFLKTACSDKAVCCGYLGYAVSRFSQDGPIETLLPVLLFMKTGTNFSVGIYSAVAALIASILLLIYAYFGKNKPLVMWSCSISQVIISILILASGSIVVFFTYYFIKKITTKLIHNDVNSSLFVLLNHTNINQYKIEHHFVYHTCGTIAQTLSCLLSLLIYNCIKTVTGMSIFLAITASFQLVSTLLIIKSDNLLKALNS